MIVKKYGIIALLMITMASLISAQHHRGILKHSEDLELTKEQEEAIWEIQYNNRQAKKSKKAEMQNSGRVDLKAQVEEFQSAIDTVLTEEQRLKWREIQAFQSEDRKVKKEELREGVAAFREQRASYIEENIIPELRKHRMIFDELLSESEKSSIDAARTKSMEPRRSGPPSKGNHDRSKENHKSIAKIIYDHKDELDQIWSEFDEELTVWNNDLETMKSEIGEDLTKNRKHHTKNRKGNRRTAGFSQLDFILIDY